MKKPSEKTIFNLKTTINAATLVAVFIVCFFILLPPPKAEPTINENLSSANAEISSEETPSPIESSSKQETSSSEEFSSEEETSSEDASSEEAPKPIPVVVTSPEENSITVTKELFTVKGTCDPQKSLYINDKKIEPTKAGEFSTHIDLKVGTNNIMIKQGDTTVTKTVKYRFVVIKSFSPNKAASYASGSKLAVSVTARKGSEVKASFNSSTIILTPKETGESEFVSFVGEFALPKDNLKDIKLGKITITGSFEGIKETFYSEEITVKKTSAVSNSNTAVTPTDSGYINVGSGYIAEVIAFQAETFDGKYTKNNADWSRPTNSYLPKGTVDYCSTSRVYDKSGEKSYVTLRCGKRVYYEYTDDVIDETTRVVKQYVGTLPDHNELEVVSFENKGKHTYLTLNTDWKAPFKITLGSQGYINPAYQDYKIENATFTYLDITFCYATEFDGKVIIPQGHPIFEKAEIIQKKSECTLRLHLKERGEFYGWDAVYNDKGQLVFSFLNPAKTKKASNEYGRDLNGTTILIDVGHGGKDVGAYGLNPKRFTESVVNLKLANLLASELKKTGAKVVLTRTEDTYLSHDARQKKLKELSPDLCIAIHHDANNASRLSGLGCFYFNAFSKKASEYVYNQSIATGLYKNGTKNRLDWHYFFLGRITTCPVVLTENGYMTNSKDFSVIANGQAMQTKAKAIARGTVEYFASICP